MAMATPNSRFPQEGRSWDALRDELDTRRTDEGDMAWDSLRNLKASYNAGEEAARIGWEAYTLFKGDNLLYGTTLYPSLPDIAGDVVAMALELLNGPEGAGGTVTTGGTESIILGVRAALNRARAMRSFDGAPRIVMPSNAHAAFTKAAELMGLEPVRVPIRDYRADPAAMAEAITDDTFMLVGSAPAYPFGHVDDITAISRMALERDLWLHVDGCIGGFFLPFVRDLGHDVPAFDFAVEGVRSMSADLHKYGYTPRGASLLLLRDEADKRYQGFEFSAWPTGVFNTMTVTGSRPAGAVAGAWAVMNHLGFSGYRDLTEKTLAGKRKIIDALAQVDGVSLCGAPQGGIVGYRGEDGLDMHAVREGLSARGWQMAAIIDPPGFQMLLNHRSGEIAEVLAQELGEAIAEVRDGTRRSTGADMAYGV
jgi:sphinganine-1-phosphate aldolase